MIWFSIEILLSLHEEKRWLQIKKEEDLVQDVLSVDDGLVFLLSKDREQWIRIDMLIIFVDVNTVMKKMIGIGMICGKIIMVVDYKIGR